MPWPRSAAPRAASARPAPPPSREPVAQHVDRPAPSSTSPAGHHAARPQDSASSAGTATAMPAPGASACRAVREHRQRGDRRPGRQRRDPGRLRAARRPAARRRRPASPAPIAGSAVSASTYDPSRCRSAAATTSAVRPELEISDGQRVPAGGAPRAPTRPPRRRRGPRPGAAAAASSAANPDEPMPMSPQRGRSRSPRGAPRSRAPASRTAASSSGPARMSSSRSSRVPARVVVSSSPSSVASPCQQPAHARRAAPTAMMAAPWRRTRTRRPPWRPRTRRGDRGRV